MPRCPGCYVPMTRTEEDGVKAHICGSCFGTWLAPVALLRRVREDVADARLAGGRTAAADRPGGAPVDGETTGVGGGRDGKMTDDVAPGLPPLVDLVEIVAESDSLKPLRCPECEKPMLKDRFQQMIPVTVDRCKHCDRIWLDTGKYNLIRRLYVEMTLSTDPQIVQLREKIAGVQVQWAGRKTLVESTAHSSSAIASGLDFSLEVLFSLLR